MPLLLIFVSTLFTVLAYSVLRLIFLIWNHQLYFSKPLSSLLWAFVVGLRFDLSAVMTLMAIPLLFSLILISFSKLFLQKYKFSIQRMVIAGVCFFQLLGLVLCLGDAEFVNFLGRRFTFDALFFLQEIPGKFWSTSATYWPLSLTALVFLFSYTWILWRWVPRLAQLLADVSQQYVVRTWQKFLWVLVFVVVTVISARGGLQNKPINFAHSQVFAVPAMNNLVLNSSFSFIQTIRRQSLPRDHFFSNADEMLHLLNGYSAEKSVHLAVRPNVVLIILESFSQELVGAANHGIGVTPFLDELTKKSLFFSDNYANARRSIEGIGALLGGVPAMMNEPFISSQYLTNYFLGIGTLLKPAGYQSHFFHGAHNSSMYFDQFMKSAGIEHYWGLNEYPDPSQYDGTWGIWDEPFLQWMKMKMDGFPEPFFASVFTLSSHSPFRVPEVFRGRFPKTFPDGVECEICESAAYTDESLRRFFAEAEKSPWFSRTVFIITADHTFKAMRSGGGGELSQYRIPMWIYAPGFDLKKVDENMVTQQVDILPTMIELAGVSHPEINFLGRSVFAKGNRFAVTFTDNHYLLIDRDVYLKYHRGEDSFNLYGKQDLLEQDELHDEKVKFELTQKLKATMQYFSQGMWDNKLYYPLGK